MISSKNKMIVIKCTICGETKSISKEVMDAFERKSVLDKVKCNKCGGRYKIENFNTVITK
jgi:uncharacterized Zn finger protein